MVNEDIKKLRSLLPKEVEKGDLHSEFVLKLSQELDSLIVEFYISNLMGNKITA